MARADRCKHYSGEVYRGGKCDAGVLVRERVGGSDNGWMSRMPCFAQPIVSAAPWEPAFKCEHFALPTKEEIAAEKAASDASFNRIMVARKAILESGAKPRMVGQLECPCCTGGSLRWSMASNKHIHASCSTAGCVSWME